MHLITKKNLTRACREKTLPIIKGDKSAGEKGCCLLPGIFNY